MVSQERAKIWESYNEVYPKLKKRDFIPVYGLFSWTKRLDKSIADISPAERENYEERLRHNDVNTAVLAMYHVWTSVYLLIGAIKGLDALISS